MTKSQGAEIIQLLRDIKYELSIVRPDVRKIEERVFSIEQDVSNIRLNQS